MAMWTSSGSIGLMFGLSLNLLPYFMNLSSKSSGKTFQKANDKGADQTVRMRRLVCACVVRKPRKTSFLASRRILFQAVFTMYKPM